MNCPRLPAVPPRRVSQIEPSWFRTLNECLEFAMTHPQGDGSTILQDPAGSLRLVGGGDGDGSSSPSSEDSGPFAAEVYNAGTGETPEWRVRLFNSKSASGTAGIVIIGSYRKTVEDMDWPAQTGMLYLDITYDSETREYKVLFDLEDALPETGDERRYILRIAEITYDEQSDSYTAHQIREYTDVEISGRWVK